MHLLRSAILGWLLTTSTLAFQLDTFEAPLHKPINFTPSDQFGPLSWGNFNGDLLLDAVTIRNGAPTLLSGIAAYSYTLLIEDGNGSVPAATCVTFAADANRNFDHVVVGSSEGVTRFTFQAGVTWNSKSVLEAPLWADPRCLVAADVDQDGDQDLLVLDASGTQMALILDLNSEVPASPLLWPVIANPATKLVVGNFVGDGNLECAVACSTGVEIFDFAGSLLFSVIDDQPGGLLATVSRPRSPRDSLACIVDNGVTQELVFCGPRGVEPAIPLNRRDVVDMASGDLNGDQRGDLALSFRGDGIILQLIQQESVPSFQMGSGAHEVTIGPDLFPSPTNDAFVGIADYDGDGDDDGFVIREINDDADGDSQQWVKLPNRLIDANEQKPKVTGAWVTYLDDTNSLQFDVSLDSMAAEPDHLDEVQLIAWNQGSGVYLEPDAYFHGIFFAGESESLLQFTVDSTFTPADGKFQHYQLRWVDWDGEAVVAAGPSAAYSLTANTDAVSLREAATGVPVPFLVFEGNLTWDGSIDQPTPGIVDIPALPAMAAGTLEVGAPQVES